MKFTHFWLSLSLTIFVTTPTIVIAQGLNVALHKPVSITTNGTCAVCGRNAAGITDGSLVEFNNEDGVIGFQNHDYNKLMVVNVTIDLQVPCHIYKIRYNPGNLRNIQNPSDWGADMITSPLGSKTGNPGGSYRSGAWTEINGSITASTITVTLQKTRKSFYTDWLFIGEIEVYGTPADEKIFNSESTQPRNKGIRIRPRGGPIDEKTVAKNGSISEEADIFTAVKAGNSSRVKELLSAKASLGNVRDSFGRTPLYKAAAEGHIEIIKMLIASSADVNASDIFSQTPLIASAVNGHLETVKFLIENGANVKGVEIIGPTLNFGYADIAKLLIDKGADVGKPGILKQAINNKHVEIAKLLIEKGAGIREPGILKLALDKGYEDIAKLLISKGMTIDSASLYEVINKDQTELLQLLLKKGENVNFIDNHKQTPLMYAASDGHLDAAKLLIEKGVAINAVDEDGNTALVFAAGHGAFNVMRLLVEKGANVNVTNVIGETPLMKAAEAGHVNVVQFLLSRKALTLLKTKDGKQAIDLASEQALSEVVDVLKKYPYDKSLAAFEGNNRKIGYRDQAGEVVISPRFDYGGKFAEGRALVARNGKYGYVNRAGIIVIPLQFKDANEFTNGKASVTHNGRSYIIDRNGRIIKRAEPQPGLASGATKPTTASKKTIPTVANAWEKIKTSEPTVCKSVLPSVRSHDYGVMQTEYIDCHMTGVVSSEAYSTHSFKIVADYEYAVSAQLLFITQKIKYFSRVEMNLLCAVDKNPALLDSWALQITSVKEIGSNAASLRPFEDMGVAALPGTDAAMAEDNPGLYKVTYIFTTLHSDNIWTEKSTEMTTFVQAKNRHDAWMKVGLDWQLKEKSKEWARQFRNPGATGVEVKEAVKVQ